MGSDPETGLIHYESFWGRGQEIQVYIYSAQLAQQNCG